MIRAALILLLMPAGLLAQGFPGSPYAPAPQGAIPTAGAMPNFYNRAVQPLSPYLNLARSGNPAVNYYYGVRPGQIANGQLPGGAPLGNSASLNPAFVPGLQQVAPGAPMILEANPGSVPGFAPIGPASFGTGLTRFTGISGGSPLGGGRVPNQTLAPLSTRPAAPRR